MATVGVNRFSQRWFV